MVPPFINDWGEKNKIDTRNDSYLAGSPEAHAEGFDHEPAHRLLARP